MRKRRTTAAALVAAAMAAALPFGAAAAGDDDAGRLRFTLRDAGSGEPVANAAIQLDDPTGTEARRTLYSAADGTALSGPLAAHEWRFTVLHPRYKKATGAATVRPGGTVAVAARFR